MKQFGIRTDGLQQVFENLFVEYLNKAKDDNFTYLEIGAAGCVSMRSFYEIIQENIRDGVNWKVIGLDLPNGWSLDWNTIYDFKYPLEISVNGEVKFGPVANAPAKAKASLMLLDDPRIFSKSLDANSVDICFIDGCHGRKCVMDDFESIENSIKKDGIVFFHDSCLFSQGTDWQGHCGENINVRQAIKDLGLFKNERSGWEFVAEINGSRASGGDGNGIVIVKKNV